MSEKGCLQVLLENIAIVRKTHGLIKGVKFESLLKPVVCSWTETLTLTVLHTFRSRMGSARLSR